MTIQAFKAPLWLSFALLLGCSTVEVKEVCKEVEDGNVACVLIKEKK
jgi:hypothetical protein